MARLAATAGHDRCAAWQLASRACRVCAATRRAGTSRMAVRRGPSDPASRVPAQAVRARRRGDGAPPPSGEGSARRWYGAGHPRCQRVPQAGRAWRRAPRRTASHWQLAFASAHCEHKRGAAQWLLPRCERDDYPLADARPCSCRCPPRPLGHPRLALHLPREPRVSVPDRGLDRRAAGGAVGLRLHGDRHADRAVHALRGWSWPRRWASW